MSVVERGAEPNSDICLLGCGSFAAQNSPVSHVPLLRVCLQVCAVKGWGCVALSPQHEGGQDMTGSEKRQLNQAAGRGMVVTTIAGMHGQVAAHWRGRTERAEAAQASRSSGACTPSCRSCSTSTSGGGCVSSRILLLPLGSAVLEPDLDLGLSEGQWKGQVEALTHWKVARGLKLVFKRHQLLIGEGSPGSSGLSWLGVWARALPLGLSLWALTTVVLHIGDLACGASSRARRVSARVLVAVLSLIPVTINGQSWAALLTAVGTIWSLGVWGPRSVVVILFWASIYKAFLWKHTEQI